MKKINFETIFVDASKCNHCGLCLQNCPAYRRYKEELTSPRGRVQLANFLIKKKIDLNKERNAILKATETCQNCFNCTMLCPANISPQNINQKFKNILGIKQAKAKKYTFRNILLKLKFRRYFVKKDNLFLTSSFNFKQIAYMLEKLKQNNFESSLYNKILALPSIFLANKTFEIPTNYKTYIFDDIENYRIVKNSIDEGKLNINENQILFITQTLKHNTINLPSDSLIVFSNVFANQKMQEDKQKLFANFKNKTLNFVNNRYYYGPNFHTKTVEYLKQIPQNILITLSERENVFLTKLVKKHKIGKKVMPIQNFIL